MLMNALHTPLVDLLGCDVPILAAGMGGVARSGLVIAVNEAGGYGCLGMVREPVALLEREIGRVRARTCRPFAVNLIPAATEPRLLDAQIDCCIALQVPAVCFFWDVDAIRIDRLKKAGIQVLHQVGSVMDAQHALRAGVDVLIAQGYEAGGHVRSEISTLALVQELVALGGVPVVAAGGIASGQALVAMLALGAQGVWCGSLFLATHESNAHPMHQQRLCRASAADTLHTYRFFRNWPMAAAVRVLPNSVTEGSHDHLRNQREPVEIARQDGQPVYLFSTDSPLRDATGDLGAMAIYAGQSCGQIHDITSAAERIRRLLAEAGSALQTLGAESACRDAPAEDVAPLASSPCGDPAWQDAPAAWLDDVQTLLAAERANAYVAAQSLQHLYDKALIARYREQHRASVRIMNWLQTGLRAASAEPLRHAGGDADALLAITDLEKRLHRLQQHRQSTQMTLGALLPLVSPVNAVHALKCARDACAG